MTIEVLFPELGNLYGDLANIRYLQQSIPQSELLTTTVTMTPNLECDFLYMGPMTEKAQSIALDLLYPHKSRLRDRFSRGLPSLFTGNSFELTGKYIKTGSSELTALELFDFHSVRVMNARYNSIFLGDYAGIKIVAFNSRFSHCYPNSLNGFAKVIRGFGLNENCPYEGICENGFIGTYLLGPLLILNPLFTQLLLKSLAPDSRPAFFDVSYAAYLQRLHEFENNATRLD